jgi:hypothetical protein
VGTIASFPGSIAVDSLGSGGGNSGLVASDGGVFGTAEGYNGSTENVWEVTGASPQAQIVPAQIGAGLPESGITEGDNLEGLAVSNGMIYGLSVGTDGPSGNSTTNALAAV